MLVSNIPDYSKMTPLEQERYRTKFALGFKTLERDFGETWIDDDDIKNEPLEAIHIQYEKFLKHVRNCNTCDEDKMHIYILNLGEDLGKKFFVYEDDIVACRHFFETYYLFPEGKGVLPLEEPTLKTLEDIIDYSSLNWRYNTLSDEHKNLIVMDYFLDRNNRGFVQIFPIENEINGSSQISEKIIETSTEIPIWGLIVVFGLTILSIIFVVYS